MAPRRDCAAPYCCHDYPLVGLGLFYQSRGSSSPIVSRNHSYTTPKQYLVFHSPEKEETASRRGKWAARPAKSDWYVPRTTIFPRFWNRYMVHNSNNYKSRIRLNSPFCPVLQFNCVCPIWKVPERPIIACCSACSYAHHQHRNDEYISSGFLARLLASLSSLKQRPQIEWKTRVKHLQPQPPLNSASPLTQHATNNRSQSQEFRLARLLN